MAGGRDPRTILLNGRNEQFEQLFEADFDGHTQFQPTLFPPCFVSTPSKSAPSKNAPYFFLFVHLKM